MKSKLLHFAIVALAITSCSTAYKSGQTPDDVYYSPARFEENKDDEDKKDDRQDQVNQASEDRRVRQTIRDRRWRDFDEYDYTYNNSPYNHCYCNCTNYGYYYNPYYYKAPIYNTITVKNTTPRKVNLSSYQGYNAVKTATTPTKITTVYNTPKYNNSNKKESLGSKIIKAFTSKETRPTSSESSSSSSNSNNTRTYTPSSSSSSSSSSSGSSGGSVTRPSRGGQ